MFLAESDKSPIFYLKFYYETKDNLFHSTKVKERGDRLMNGLTGMEKFSHSRTRSI